jgi:hypothetical protein
VILLYVDLCAGWKVRGVRQVPGGGRGHVLHLHMCCGLLIVCTLLPSRAAQVGVPTFSAGHGAMQLFCNSHVGCSATAMFVDWQPGCCPICTLEVAVDQ